MNSQARFPMPYGYGFIPFVYSKQVGESAGLPRSALITAYVGLGLPREIIPPKAELLRISRGESCLPTEQHLRMSCVERS